MILGDDEALPKQGPIGLEARLRVLTERVRDLELDNNRRWQQIEGLGTALRTLVMETAELRETLAEMRAAWAG